MQAREEEGEEESGGEWVREWRVERGACKQGTHHIWKWEARLVVCGEGRKSSALSRRRGQAHADTALATRAPRSHTHAHTTQQHDSLLRRMSQTRRGRLPSCQATASRSSGEDETSCLKCVC